MYEGRGALSAEEEMALQDGPPLRPLTPGGAGEQVGGRPGLGFSRPGLQPLGEEENEEDDDPDQVENLTVHFTLLCCVHVRRERVALLLNPRAGC